MGAATMAHGEMMQAGRKATRLLGVLALGLAVAGCGSKDTILSGERIDIRDGLVRSVADETVENRTQKIALGSAQSRSSWTTIGATSSNNSGHNAFTSGTPQLVWTGEIGKGSARRTRLDTNVVAASGLIAAVDTDLMLTALSASTGEMVWQKALTPAGEKPGGASGAALTISGERLYASTGYGEIVAMNLANGAEVWRQKLGAVGVAGIKISDGLAYVSAADGQAWAIETSSGRVKWTLPGPSNTTSRAGAPSPVVSGKFAIFPFASGDLYGVFKQGGVRYWSATVSGKRQGAVYANVSDISSDPVVSGSTVYVGNQSGSFAAINIATGEHRWTAKEGGTHVSLVIGGSVFVVSDDNSLVRLSANTGETIWKQELPLFTTDRARRQREIHAHFGPIAAGGRIWLASSDGFLRQYDPASGALLGRVELPDAAAAGPIIVGSVMYVLLANGEIAALR